MINKTSETKTLSVDSVPSAQSGSHHHIVELFKFTSPLEEIKYRAKPIQQQEEMPLEGTLSTHEFLSILTAKSDSMGEQSVTEKLNFSINEEFSGTPEKSKQILPYADSTNNVHSNVGMENEWHLPPLNIETPVAEKHVPVPQYIQSTNDQSDFQELSNITSASDFSLSTPVRGDFKYDGEPVKHDKEQTNYPVERILNTSFGSDIDPVDFDVINIGTKHYFDSKISDEMVHRTSQVVPNDVNYSLDGVTRYNPSPIYSNSETKYSIINGTGLSPDRVTEMHSQAVNHLSYVNPNSATAGPANHYSPDITLEIEMPSHIRLNVVANIEHPTMVQFKTSLHQFFSEYLAGQSEVNKGRTSMAALYRPASVTQSEFFQKRYSVLEINGRIVVRIRDFFLSETASTQLFNQLQKFCNNNLIPNLTLTLNGITKTLKGV